MSTTFTRVVVGLSVGESMSRYMRGLSLYLKSRGLKPSSLFVFGADEDFFFNTGISYKWESRNIARVQPLFEALKGLSFTPMKIRLTEVNSVFNASNTFCYATPQAPTQPMELRDRISLMLGLPAQNTAPNLRLWRFDDQKEAPREITEATKTFMASAPAFVCSRAALSVEQIQRGKLLETRTFWL